MDRRRAGRALERAAARAKLGGAAGGAALARGVAGFVAIARRAGKRDVAEIARGVYRRVLLTLVPIRPRSRGERRSLRTFSRRRLSAHPLAFNPRTSTPFNSASDAFELHPDIIARMEWPSSVAADIAAEEAAYAERRRLETLAGRSVRDVNVARSRAGPVPFDSAAFHAVAAKRKLEIVSKQCLASVKQVMSHKWSFPFVKPVDAAALGLENYHDIVKQPMDLGTVRANIEKGGVYAACEEVNRDVELTFANAMLYNGAQTDVHVMAATLKQFWEPRWAVIQEKVAEVDESMTAEKESAEKKSAEMHARQTLAAEEMRCAGLMADLDQLKRSLEDLKRTSVRITRPMDEREKKRLANTMMKLPRRYREEARDVIAETEGEHMVPVEAVARWGEILEDLPRFSAVAHRRLALFAKNTRRNATRGIIGGGHGVEGDWFSESDEEEEPEPEPEPAADAIASAKMEAQKKDDAADDAKTAVRKDGVEDETATNGSDGSMEDETLALAAAAAAAAAAAKSTTMDVGFAGGFASGVGGSVSLGGGGAAAAADDPLLALVGGGMGGIGIGIGGGDGWHARRGEPGTHGGGARRVRAAPGVRRGGSFTTDGDDRRRSILRPPSSSEETTREGGKQFSTRANAGRHG